MLLSAGLLDLASHRHKTALRRRRADDLPKPQQADERCGNAATIVAGAKAVTAPAPLRRTAA